MGEEGRGMGDRIEEGCVGGKEGRKEGELITLTCDIVGHIVAIAGRVSVENARDRVRASGALRGRRCGARRHRRGHRLPAEGDIAAHVIFRVWGGGWGIGRAKQAIV